MFEEIRIGVIVVTFNRLACLKQALELFEQQTFQPAYILVVDNASTDGTRSFLEAWKAAQTCSIERHILIKDVNDGGSGGFYAGIERALSLDADWLWLSDDDAYPESKCLEEAALWISDNSVQDVSALCAAVVNNGAIDTGHRRRIELDGIRIREHQIEKDEYESPFLLNALSFVGAIVKKEAVKSAGLPLREYFIWYDDTEYSLRLSEVGKIVCIPSMKVDHDVSKIEDSYTWKGYYGQRNCLDMIQRHFPRRVYLYARIRAIAKALLLRRRSREIGNMYAEGIHDQSSGNFGLHAVYKPGWNPRGA